MILSNTFSVGIARLKQKRRDFIYWKEIPQWLARQYGDFVWSWTLQNGCPEEGARIPYQEYLARNQQSESIEKISVIIEEDLARRFKFVSRNVANDDATTLIEETIRALKQVKNDRLLDNKLYNWDHQIEWLDSILRECWKKRGLYPGLAATLNYSGFKNPGLYIKNLLPKIGSEDIRDYVFSRLELENKKKRKIDKQEADLYADARQRFVAFNPTVKKLLKERFSLFDLSDKQVQNILGDHRIDYGITSSLETILDNPYCICEEYFGNDNEDRIGFHRIDNGMILHPESSKYSEAIQLDDPRRLRAIIVKELQKQAKNGHTFLDQQDLIANVYEKHQKSGRQGQFLLDEATFTQHKETFTQKVEIDQVSGLNAIFLKRLHSDERKIRNEVLKLMNEELLPPSGRKWEKIIRNGFREKGLKSKLIQNALYEQVDALEKLYRTRFGILTGGAGVGKTTVLWAFIKGIHEIDPNHRFLLLAPTGKASVILSEKIELEARTIHSFLLQYKWINPKNWSLITEGGRIAGGYNTVIIDESSMLNIELLATLFRSLNWNEIERVVLVGDPSQLPPIGPGKPMADIIDYLLSDEKRVEMRLAQLNFNCRQNMGSLIAALAAQYARSEERPNEEVIWLLDQKQQKADLAIDFWADEKELYEKLEITLRQAIQTAAEIKEIPLPKDHLNLSTSYDTIHGLTNFKDKKDLEAIQIITPYRHKASGVDPLNFYFQRLLRGEDIVRKFSVNGFVWNDKILQTRNSYYQVYDHERPWLKEHIYVPNGSIGYVFPKNNENKVIQTKFPPDFVRYSFYLSRKQCEENLELGYVLSVHKSQGSQFINTILVLPAEESDFLSRELLYTALTRAQGRLYLLMEKDPQLLKNRLWMGHSEILRRNSALFKTAKGIPKGGFETYKPENLIYTVLPKLLVRSYGEVLISKALVAAGIPFYYEKPLLSKDKQTYRYPDFTFQYKRKTYFWEHRGRINDPQYAEDWKRKEKWFIRNGYDSQLLVTPIEGMTLEKSIINILRDRLGIIESKETQFKD